MPWDKKTVLYLHSVRLIVYATLNELHRFFPDITKIMFYNNQHLLTSKKLALQAASVRFVISSELGAYLVTINGNEVVIEPHNDGVGTLATANEALALQELSRFMLNVRSRPDPCDFLLDFYARNGWKIEETETEAFQPGS